MYSLCTPSGLHSTGDDASGHLSPGCASFGLGPRLAVQPAQQVDYPPWFAAKAFDSTLVPAEVVQPVQPSSLPNSLGDEY